jgi:hypothetical protein
MTDISGWRRAYNAVERNVSPRVEALVHSDEFAHMTAVIARTRRLAGNRVNGIAARAWHLMNLPAGTDLQRLRMQVGALDREVRRLSLQLDRDTRKSD